MKREQRNATRKASQTVTYKTPLAPVAQVYVYDIFKHARAMATLVNSRRTQAQSAKQRRGM